MAYAQIDEYLNVTISRYYFPSKLGNPQRQRSKRAQLFKIFVLEELSLLKKLALLRAICTLPRGIREDIERLNALRNGLAHSLFPEGLKKMKPVWKGLSIFSLDGVQRLEQDMAKVAEYFGPTMPHLMRVDGAGNESPFLAPQLRVT